MSKPVMNKLKTNSLNINLLDMNKVNINSVLRYLEVLRYQLGALGLLGLLGLLAGLVMLLSAVMPAEQALQHKKDEITWLNARPQRAMQQTQAPSLQAPSLQAPSLDDEQALQQFYQQFPPVGEVSKVLAQIHQLAQEKGISLLVGEYKLAPDANNPRLMRYEIIFPVQGSYKNLRAFIASASEKFPTLGLAEVNIKRESVKETSVQIKLSYALLLRREP